MALAFRQPALAALAAAALFLTACGGSSGPKPAPLPDLKAKVQVRAAWSENVGEAGPYVFTPALWDGDVLAASNSGRIVRLEGRNGRVKWRKDLDVPLAGGVTAAEGLVFVGTTKGELIALSAEGELAWRVQLSSEVLGPVSVSEGAVVVRTGDGKIFCLEAQDGARRWEYDHTLPSLLIRTATGVALQGGVVYAGMPGGKLLALSAQTGALLWDAPVAQPRGDSELERIVDVVSVPWVEDGRACAVAYQGRIACFDVQKGTLVWARAASSRGGLAADDRYFYFVDDASGVQAIDRETGASVWKQDVLAHRGLGQPTVVGRFLVVGDFEGYVHFFDTEDGALAARLATDGSEILAAPVRIGDANLLVQTTGGRVYAVSVR